MRRTGSWCSKPNAAGFLAGCLGVTGCGQLAPLPGMEAEGAPRTTIDDLLADARARLVRLGPQEARAAMRTGALLLDIRTESHRASEGVVDGSIWLARNVLEWRCDPASEGHDERIADFGRQLIVMCDEGYASSLAAATLQQLGFTRATDLAGGFRAWHAAGLPVSRGESDRDAAQVRLVD